MEDVQEYLKNRLNEFKQGYNAEYKLNSYCDKELKRRWKVDREKAKNQWQYINSVEDVRNYISGFIGQVEQYQNIKGIPTDTYDMDLALYKVNLAISKMAQCYESNKCDFDSCGKEEIDEIFDTLYHWLEEMNNVNMRRMMQD